MTSYPNATQPDIDKIASKENIMPLSRVVVLPYDGFLGVVAGSTTGEDELAILDAVEQAARKADVADDTVKVVVVYGEAEVKQVRLLRDDLDRVTRLVLDANKRAHRTASVVADGE